MIIPAVGRAVTISGRCHLRQVGRHVLPTVAGGRATEGAIQQAEDEHVLFIQNGTAHG